ncbi:MAG: regulatory protein RecX [Candidatus Omnitrophota bacterium]
MDQLLDQAKKSAFRLLKFRLRSGLEINQHLKKKGFTKQIINKTLTFLQELGYIDDLKFAKVWVNYRLKLNPCSKNLLQHELREKGIDPNFIKEALLVINADAEFDIAREIAKKRLRQIKGLPVEVIARRLAGYLARRGYTQSLIVDLVKELINDEK